MCSSEFGSMDEFRLGQDNILESASSRVIAANVEMYRSHSKSYDQSWESSFGRSLDAELKSDLDRIAANFSGSPESFRCLDCGAGTGAVTLDMLARGWAVTAIDVSPDMLELLKNKIVARKLKSAMLINEPAERFLASEGLNYHLITFNSVLHHLYRYSAVVGLAADHLVPGGFLYSNVDRVMPSRRALAEFLDSLDTLLAKLSYERSDLIPGTVRRVRKFFGRTDPKYRRKIASVGDLAEFHARSGVDDIELVQMLKRKGLCIVEHSRYPLARTGFGKRMNGWLKFREEFKIIAQKKDRTDQIK